MVTYKRGKKQACSRTDIKIPPSGYGDGNKEEDFVNNVVNAAQTFLNSSRS